MKPPFSIYVYNRNGLKQVNFTFLKKILSIGLLFFITLTFILSCINVYFSEISLFREISSLKEQQSCLTGEYEITRQHYNILAEQYIEIPMVKRIISLANPNLSDETVTLWTKLLVQHKTTLSKSLNQYSQKKLQMNNSPYSIDHGIALVLAVAAVESDFNLDLTSEKGAYGPMQLHPATIEYIGLRNPGNPTDNINAGIKYLRQLLNRFRQYPDQLELALASYNAGLGRVSETWMPLWGERWQNINHGLSLREKHFIETRSYVSTAVALARIFSSGDWNCNDPVFWSDYKHLSRFTNFTLSFQTAFTGGNYR